MDRDKWMDLFLHHDLDPGERSRVEIVRCQFADMAKTILNLVPPGQMQTLALIRLFEAKNAAVMGLVVRFADQRRMPLVEVMQNDIDDMMLGSDFSLVNARIRYELYRGADLLVAILPKDVILQKGHVGWYKLVFLDSTGTEITHVSFPEMNLAELPDEKIQAFLDDHIGQVRQFLGSTGDGPEETDACPSSSQEGLRDDQG